MKRDRHIFQLIETEYRRQLKGIELIASEKGYKIDLEGFLYWYQDANPHITDVTKAN